MDSVDIAFLTIAEAAALLRRKELSPVDLTKVYLDRIDRLDPFINSFLTVTGDLAMKQAKAAEAELAKKVDRGPLHGIPVGLKDLFATKGIRTTAHSRVLSDWIPEEDATVVTKLRDAGAILLGKLAMHEFAMASHSMDSPFPPARNPWNPEHIPGGSSSGSAAALAAGLCMGALGSDTGGSIRYPAALCGIAGLKPNYGRVSNFGAVPMSWSLDHVGPMARSVEDCALMLQAIAGYDPHDSSSINTLVPNYQSGMNSSPRGLRLGVPRHLFTDGRGLNEEVAGAFETAIAVLQDIGIEVVDVLTPIDETRKASPALFSIEGYVYHEETLTTHPELLGENVLTRVRNGVDLSATDYVRAQRARAAVVVRLRELLTEVDGLVMPTVAYPALPFEGFDPDYMMGGPSFTGMYNLAGVPAISIPCGFSKNGLPIGMQVVGRPFDESTVLSIAHAFERATPWNTKRPPLFDSD